MAIGWHFIIVTTVTRTRNNTLQIAADLTIVSIVIERTWHLMSINHAQLYLVYRWTYPSLQSSGITQMFQSCQTLDCWEFRYGRITIWNFLPTWPKWSRAQDLIVIALTLSQKAGVFTNSLVVFYISRILSVLTICCTSVVSVPKSKWQRLTQKISKHVLLKWLCSMKIATPID